MNIRPKVEKVLMQIVLQKQIEQREIPSIFIN